MTIEDDNTPTVDFDFKNLLEEGAEKQRFVFVMNLIFNLCKMLNVCPGCVAEELDIYAKHVEYDDEPPTPGDKKKWH